jgi:hypothetical protein
MHRTTRRTIAGLAALAGALALGTTGAAAQGAPVQKVAADVTSGPFHLTFRATRPAGAPSTSATGTFDAWTSGGATTLMHLQGPVTCLDVRGNRVGLFYPIDRSEPSLFSKLHTGVFIFMTVDGNGHATAVQFLPVPVRKVTGCAPQAALLPASGSATLTS